MHCSKPEKKKKKKETNYYPYPNHHHYLRQIHHHLWLNHHHHFLTRLGVLLWFGGAFSPLPRFFLSLRDLWGNISFRTIGVGLATTGPQTTFWNHFEVFKKFIHVNSFFF